MMKRGSTAAAVEGIAGRIRSRLPDATLRTTCLLGFPGEEAEHVDHLAEYVTRSEFDHLGAFVYSPEDGTPAARMPGRPARFVAGRRRNRIMRVQKGISDRKLAARVGAVEEVLLESRHPGSDNAWLGRSRRLAPEVDGRILVEGVRAGEGRGDFVPVLIKAAAGYDLRGVVARGTDGKPRKS
jgi:ribosomal protein S12 methylthiotransferase